MVRGRTPDWTGHFVSHLVPPRFESYAKVLHKHSTHCEFIDDPLSEPEKTILRIPSCEPLKSFVEAKETIPLDFLECIEVTPQTRVDFFASMPQPPHPRVTSTTQTLPFASSSPALYNKSFTHAAGDSREIYDSFSRS